MGRTSTLVGTMYCPSTSYTHREWLLRETLVWLAEEPKRGRGP